MIFIYAQATGFYPGVASGDSTAACELPATATTTIPVHYFLDFRARHHRVR
jgi:hypothetical protein